MTLASRTPLSAKVQGQVDHEMNARMNALALPAVFAELLRIGQELGLTIRREAMQVPATRLAGGLVRVCGRSVVILDESAPLIDRVATLADILVSFDLRRFHVSAESMAALGRARIRRRRLVQRARVVRLLRGIRWPSRPLGPELRAPAPDPEDTEA